MDIKRRYWELAGEGEFKKLRASLMLTVLCVANVGMAVVHLQEMVEPRYAIRTDLAGHADVIYLDEAKTPRDEEMLEFVKQFAFRAFSWTPSTAEEDWEYVESRVTPGLSKRLPSLIPGFQMATEASARNASSPRISVRIDDIRLRDNRKPLRVELLLALNFWKKESLPAALGHVDPDADGWRRYGVVVQLSQVQRSLGNPNGLLVADIQRVRLEGL